LAISGRIHVRALLQQENAAKQGFSLAAFVMHVTKAGDLGPCILIGRRPKMGLKAVHE
jgi:hypothetical protein